MKYVALILLLSSACCAQNTNPVLDTAREFEMRAWAEANAIKAEQSAKASATAKELITNWRAARQKHRVKYKADLPLNDYTRVDREVALECQRKVEQMNDDKLARFEAAESERMANHQKLEIQKFAAFQTAHEAFLQRESQYFDELRRRDIKVWVDDKAYHRRHDCPFCIGGAEQWLSDQKSAAGSGRVACLLCQAPPPDVNLDGLPQRKAEPPRPQSTAYTPTAFPKAKEGEHWSMGQAVYLDRVRVQGRKYDAYFAEIQPDTGFFALKWAPWNKLTKSDIDKVTDAIVARRERERERELRQESGRATERAKQTDQKSEQAP
ncbi:MAG: hypothetical protein NXI04_14320 [Planctomycetaceae bacterium]|nr:hypothetical protein [Planctomycetaceae bacterium]